MSDPDKIVLFDGVCNLCSSSVQFIIRHDRSAALKFSSLQSAKGQELIARYGIPKETDSVIFIEKGQAYSKSAAALCIAAYFGGAWKLLQIFRWIPAAIRDFFYDIIARNRYKWFGKKESCMMPSAETRGRFIDL